MRDLTPGQVISVPTPHRAMVRVNALSDAIAGIRFILVDDATTGEPVIAPLRLGIDTLVALHAEAGSA